MKLFVWTLFLFPCLLFGQINQRFTNPNNCKACHATHVQDWENSWHANSHENKNSLYKAAVTYVQKNSFKTRAQILNDCAKCHNPRLEKQNIDEEYIYAKAFGIQTQESQKIEKAFHEKHLENGISCYVCHNIDTLHKATTPSKMGTDLISWTTGDAIVGPFAGSERSPFHESHQRDFFKQGNALCLTCHEGNPNQHPVPGYETGAELALSKTNERCVDCHMGEPRQEIIAPHIVKKGEVALVREVRSHQFSGARNSDILKDALRITAQARPDGALIRIQNLTPHRVPTGFGGRSLALVVSFFSEETLLGTQTLEFRAVYRTQTGEEALSYIAHTLEKDTRLNPYQTQAILFPTPKNTTKVEAKVVYYLLAPSLQSLLEIDDPVFTSPYPVAQSSAFF